MTSELPRVDVVTTYRILIQRELGPELPADPECYFCTYEETVQLLDQVLDSERRWPHLSELRTIEITAVQVGLNASPRLEHRPRPVLPLDQGTFFDNQPF